MAYQVYCKLVCNNLAQPGSEPPQLSQLTGQQANPCDNENLACRRPEVNKFVGPSSPVPPIGNSSSMTTTNAVTIELTGASGKKYTFHVYPMGTELKPLGGVYAFTLAKPKMGGGNTHSILYIGQTGDLSSRFDDHHKEDCFTRRGANRHCAMVVENEDARLTIERDLIDAYNPPCNG